MPNRALFLDRDGVINANYVRNGKAYAPRTLEEFRLLPGVHSALARAKAAGFRLIVITNQPDVPAGITPRATVDAMHEQLRRSLPLDDIKICFHQDSDNCACRKPKPGMLFEAATEHNIDLAASYFIGDRWRDIGAGNAVGCFTVLIDYGLAQEVAVVSDAVATSLAEAVELIIKRESASDY